MFSVVQRCPVVESESAVCQRPLVWSWLAIGMGILLVYIAEVAVDGSKAPAHLNGVLYTSLDHRPANAN